MANSQESGLSGLIDSFSSLGNDDTSPQQIRHYKVLVTDELERIHDTYFALWYGIVNPPDPLVIFNQVDIRRELLDQLQSKRLPTLRRQINSLSKALITNPTDPHHNNLKPVPKLKLVLKILSKLDHTMGKIKFAIACIHPELEAAEVRSDKDFKQLKSFICCRLAFKIYEVNGHVCELLQTYRRLVEDSGHLCDDHEAQKRAEVLTMTDECSDAIDKTLKVIAKSELNHIQDEWRLNIESLNETLEIFTEFIHQTTVRLEEQRRHPMSRDGPTSRHEGNLLHPHPGMAHARTSVIAAVKLARLFLSQLLKISNDTENFRMVSDLTTRELDIFVTMITTISVSTKSLVYGLSEEIGEDQFNDPVIIHQSITHLLSAPRLIMLMINYIFVPNLSHQQADQPSPKILYKAWFCQWNRLYHLAIRVFHGGIEFLVPQP
ncbi:hypothetical protein PGTUg99_009728 [Puccinia graminis f. sp. tritici]|uniref:Uncharacterized protein n=1 Tax=Puccinia graminis f. sp. tritici TaxID=56615 RepID=A0A5B0LWV8_PUCGR|nr:hypothetical protein PGTUg99_009728 [Puccinia graminis f. sp. tritici]